MKPINVVGKRANAPKSPKGITRGGKHRFDIEAAGISGTFYADPSKVKGVEKVDDCELVLTLKLKE
jgi:hypothetical protein